MALEYLKNSFVTVEEADSFFENRLGASSWSEMEISDKEKALVTASSRINLLTFVGLKKSPSQDMEFPRNFAPDVPRDIKNATCIEALAIWGYLQINSEEDFNGIGFSYETMKLGDASLSGGEWGKGNQGTISSDNPLISSEAMAILEKWLKKGFNIQNIGFREVY